MRWKTGSFKICSFPHPVIGAVRGPFGIHGNKYGRHIVHLQTGMVVVSGAWLTEKMARSIVLELIPLGDWSFGITGDTQGGFKTLIQPSREIILHHQRMANFLLP